jgi:hypothetical protein
MEHNSENRKISEHYNRKPISMIGKFGRSH